MDRKQPIIKFINLHSHSDCGSPFDAIGHPNVHFDFAYQNGMDRMSLTDHGNGNGISWATLHAKKMNKEGRKFSPIFGCEVYFHPSLDDWRALKRQKDEEKKDKKNKGKEDTVSGAILENEEETKSKKPKDPLKKRHHFVLLAKNQHGLNNLYSLISKSFEGDNFYSFPRIDFEMLKNLPQPLDLIGLTACLGGVMAGVMWEHFEHPDDFIVEKMMIEAEKFVSILGKENFFLELQWIASPEQHRLNKLLIETSKRTGIDLVSTADSHYPSPDLWQARALYKKINPRFIDQEIGKPLPQNVDETGYELYPKNGDQMFASYQKYSQMNGISYDDQIILESIERTHKIAFEMIESFFPDNTVRLPEFVIPPGKTADEALREKAFFCLAKMGIDDHGNYEVIKKQLDYELDVITSQKFSQYFLTMKEIADIANERMISGPGRGCFLQGSRVFMNDGLFASIETILVGDEVVDAFGNKQKVIDTLSYDVDEEIVVLDFGGGKIIECTKDHKFLVQNEAGLTWKKAEHLTENDDVVEV